MKVPPGGGSVKISDGTSVTIPAGAVAQSTVITIGNEPNAVNISDTVLLGTVYRFEPEGTQFKVPVTVTVAYDPTMLPAGTAAGDVAIMTAPVGATDFVALPTAIVDATHVSATTTHFSDFVATAHKKSQGGTGDMSVSAAAADMTMAGPPADMTMLPGGDMTLPPDFASKCPHTWNASTCTLTANATTCGGSFSLNCAQSICFCGGGNNGKTCQKPANYANSCPPQSVVESIWTTCCMFP